MERSPRTRRGTTGLALAVALLALACDYDPAGVGAFADEAERPPVVSPANGAPVWTAATLIGSELERLAGSLASTPGAKELTDALVRLELAASVAYGRPVHAASLVARSIDALAATEAGAIIAPELDALRLMLDALRFDDPDTDPAAPSRRRTI